MDPNENLREQIEIANRIMHTGTDEGNYPYDQDRLAELVLELDAWITGGGFLPTQWVDREKEQ